MNQFNVLWEKICEIDLFSAVGEPLEEQWLLEEKFIIQVFSWQEACRHCTGPLWNLVRVTAANVNKIRFSDIMPGVKVPFTYEEVVTRAEADAAKVISPKLATFLEKGLISDDIAKIVLFDFSRIFVERAVAEYLEPSFFTGLLYWYALGHFPCGWEGLLVPPPLSTLIVF